MEPNNVRAWAEIARAYMLVGETEAARAEFETTKKQGVPPEVAATIDKLVVAIDRMADASRTSIKGYIEGIIGHDSNANAAPSRSTVAVPVLGGLPFTLDSDSRTRSDWFGTLGGGISIRHPVSPGVVLLGALRLPSLELRPYRPRHGQHRRLRGRPAQPGAQRLFHHRPKFHPLRR